MIFEESFYNPKAHFLKPIEYEIDNNGCWNCTSHCRTRFGYAKIKRGKFIHAHRYVMETIHGSLPTDVVVMHKCDNPSCINPSHLELGTQTTNNIDKVKKNRQAYGARNGMAKLKEKEVLNIRNDNRSAKVIACEYNVSISLVHKIKSREIWTQLEEDAG